MKEKYMKLALKEAKKSLKKDEVPVERVNKEIKALEEKIETLYAEWEELSME